MKRWPQVVSPAAMPSTAKGTISAMSCGVASGQRIPRSGRTQRSASGFVEAAPQRIDFCQGKARMIAGTICDRVFRRAARLFDHRHIEFTLLGVPLDRRVFDPRETGALQEPLNRHIRGADARTLALLAQCWLPRG